MEDNSEVHFKAYCKFSNKKFEIRRFSLLSNNVYIAPMLDSVRKLFQLQESCSFHLFWIDEEDDEIKINYQEELAEAVKVAKRNSGFVRLLITITDDNLSHVHENILCDICDNIVVGIRYLCTVCDNFDICMTCEAQGFHSEHRMLRITKSSENVVPNPASTSMPTNKHSSRRFFAQRMNTIHRSSEVDEEIEQQRRCFDEKPRRNRRCHRRGFDTLTCDHPHPWECKRGRHNRDHFYGKEFRNEAAKVAEEATNFALKQATNIMKGIWTGWSGEEPRTERQDSCRAQESSENKEESCNVNNDARSNGSRSSPMQERTDNVRQEHSDQIRFNMQAGLSARDNEIVFDIPITIKPSPAEASSKNTSVVDLEEKMEKSSIASSPERVTEPVIEIGNISVNPPSIPMNEPVIEVEMDLGSSDGDAGWSLVSSCTDESKKVNEEQRVNENLMDMQEEAAAPMTTSQRQESPLVSLSSSTNQRHVSPLISLSSSTSSESSTEKTQAQTSTVSTQVYPQLKPLYPHPDRRVRLALEHMMMMGYDDSDGSLTELLEKHNGNINRALDELSRK